MFWNKYKYFYEVARQGSFTKAAEHLNISQPSISRAVAELEYYYKVPFFHRYSRGVKLTAEGKVLLEHVEKMINEASAAKTRIRSLQVTNSGKLNLAVPEAFTNTLLFIYICDFLKLYPEINLNIIYQSTAVNFINGEVDAAIHSERNNDPSITQTLLTSGNFKVYASPTYIEKHGKPSMLADLAQHRCITLAEDDWLTELMMQDGQRCKPAMTANSMECLLEAANRTLGIITFPDNSPRLKEYGLIELFPSLKGPEYNFYFSTPTILQNTRLIKLLRDFLVERISKDIKKIYNK